MQQTSKYQFNLVEGSDDFSPTPLNQNMEKVEEELIALSAALTPEGVPCQYGTFYFTGSTAAGSALITFTFSPRLLILEFYERVYIISQGSSVSLDFGMTHYTVYLQLSGKALELSQNDEDITVGYSGKFVAWP